MDLRNYQITVGEILENQQARILLQREFPQLMTPMMLRMGRNMTIKSVLQFAGNIPRQKINRVLKELEEL